MNGRGLHPEVRDSSFRWWSFDDSEEPEVRELIDGSLQLDVFGSTARPEVLPSPIGTRSRGFNRTGTSEILTTGDASADSPTMQGEWTVGMWLRFRSTVGSDRIVLALRGDSNNMTQPHNIQYLLQYKASGVLELVWEDGAGNNNFATFSDFDVPLNRWLYVVTRKTLPSTATAELIVGAEVTQTVTGITNCDGGTDSAMRWVAGAQVDVASVNSECPVDIASVHVWDEALPIDEIKSDFRRGHMLDAFTHVDVRVEVEDANGLNRDLTNLDDVDFVNEVSFTDSVDNAVSTAKVTLLREQFDLALAHLRTDTKLNLTDVDVVTSYDPLVEIKRPISIFMAVVPLGILATGSDWQQTFQGKIDKVDWGGETVVVNARDDGGDLVDTWIEEEVLNDTIISGLPPEKQPSYGATAGDALESVQQDILNDNDNSAANDTVAGLVVRTGSYDPVTLAVQGTPTWLLLPYRQRREPVMTAVRTLAGQIGWETRYRHNQGALPEDDAWQFTLYEPDRARLDSDLLLTENEVESVNQVSLDVKNIRNVVRIVYPSSESTLPAVPVITGYTVRRGWSGLDGAGQRNMAFIELENDASVLRFGRRFMELGEASSSQIDTIDEARRMAFSANEDLNSPDLEKTATTNLMPFIELNDLIRFEVIKELYTVIQKLAVVGLTHTVGAKATTQLQLRGKPAVGFKRWLKLEVKPGQGRPGIADPRLALTDSERGPLLRVIRNLMDQSDYGNGGKFLAIRNQDFQFFTAGLENPPDAWRYNAIGGSWGVDVLENSSVTRTGGHSIEFTSTTGQLSCDLVPIESDAVQTPAFSFELQWQKSVAAGREPVVIIDWFAADRTTSVGSPAVLSPGAGTSAIVPEQWPAAPAVASQWFNSRADGIQPPSGARFAQISISGGAGVDTGSMYVDKVTMYRTTRAALVYDDATTYGAGGAIAAGATSENIPFLSTLNTTVTPNLVGWNRGQSIVDGKVALTGCHWLAKEPGTVDYEAFVWVTDLLAVAGAKTWRIELVLNGTYDAGGVRTGGTVIDSDEETATWTTVPPRALKMNGSVQLAETDRLTVDLNFAAGPGGSSLSVAIGFVSGSRQEPTRFNVRMRGVD